MEIRIKYSREEISEIVMEHHIKKFGAAPEGEKWNCSGDYYAGWNVENIKIEPETNPAEAMEAKE